MSVAPDRLAGMVRFVAEKTTPTDKTMGQMLDLLLHHCSPLAQTGSITVPRSDCELVARGFAGVARFLQEHILPEALHNQDDVAIEQVKGSIEVSLFFAADLLKQLNDPAEVDRQTFRVEIPKPKDAIEH